jgi:hypothetical protein
MNLVKLGDWGDVSFVAGEVIGTWNVPKTRALGHGKTRWPKNIFAPPGNHPLEGLGLLLSTL